MNKIKKELRSIERSIRRESVSYSELAFLQDHQQEVLNYCLNSGNPTLCEWAAIPEERWMKGE